MKTEEQRIVTKEDLGLDYYPDFVAATDEYFYFYKGFFLLCLEKLF